MRYKKEQMNCTRGDLAIHCVRYEPEDGKNSHPTVILSHEFGGNTHTLRRYAMEYVDRGYLAVSFDFCGSGSGKSEGDSRRMSVVTERDDLEAVMAQTLALPQVDKSRVVLAGGSQGGFVAAMAAARHPREVSALVLYYPAFCIPDNVLTGTVRGRPINFHRETAHFNLWGVDLGARYMSDAKMVDLERDIYSYPGPVLICHGTDDVLVDISYARDARREYPNARLVEIPGGDHCFTKTGFETAIKATFQFLR